MAHDNSRTFTVPGLRMRLSSVRFRPTVCGSNLLRESRSLVAAKFFQSPLSIHTRWCRPQLHWNASVHTLQLIETVQATQHVNAEVHTTRCCAWCDEALFVTSQKPDLWNSKWTSVTLAFGFASKYDEIQRLISSVCLERAPR